MFYIKSKAMTDEKTNKGPKEETKGHQQEEALSEEEIGDLKKVSLKKLVRMYRRLEREYVKCEEERHKLEEKFKDKIEALQEKLKTKLDKKGIEVLVLSDALELLKEKILDAMAKAETPEVALRYKRLLNLIKQAGNDLIAISRHEEKAKE